MEIDLELLNLLPAARRLEIAANIHHKAFTPSEIAEAAEEIWEYARKDAENRMRSGKPCGNLPQGQTGKTRDKIGRIFDISGKTLEKIQAVVQAAKEDSKFTPLVEQMDHGNVQSAFVEVQKQKKLARHLKAAEEFRASSHDRGKLYPGDFRKMEVEANSVDLIFTDPPYTKEHLPIYRDLGLFAKRVLKEGGSLLSYAGHYAIPETVNMLGEHLTYHWLLIVRHKGDHAQMRSPRVFVHYKPILWYVKGTPKSREYLMDMVESEPPGKVVHPWEQSVVEAEYYINKLTLPGEVVCDPMMGSGTTGEAATRSDRFFIGAEINPEYFSLAKARVMSYPNVSRQQALQLDK